MNPSAFSIGPLIRTGTSLLFLGRAWQHAIKEMPYAVLWDMPHLQDAMSIIFFVMAGLVWLPKQWIVPHRLVDLLWIGMIGVLVASLASYQHHPERAIIQFWEHSAQMWMPILCWAWFKDKLTESWIAWGTKIAVAFTFLCHGLFALGWPYELPGNFLAMTELILSVDHAGATSFLLIAGTLDLLIVVGLWFRQTALVVLPYAAFWGTATAIARVWAYSGGSDWGMDLWIWLPETLLRAPHAIVPVVLWLFIRSGVWK
ncbi:MAG: hypothetical protein AAF399_11285 [Bacteroidota bacterium]